MIYIVYITLELLIFWAIVDLALAMPEPIVNIISADHAHININEGCCNKGNNAYDGENTCGINSKPNQVLKACAQCIQLKQCAQQNGLCMCSKVDCELHMGEFQTGVSVGASCGCCVAPQGWEEFKITYGKLYKQGEEHSAFLNFIENSKLIRKHDNKSWKVGMNTYGDTSETDFKFQRTGASKSGVGGINEGCTPYTATLAPPKPKQDWRMKDAVTSVKDQKSCGSCWTFAAAGSTETQYVRNGGNLTSMSEQNILDCSPQGSCAGGRPQIAFNYIKNYGIESFAEYPYTGTKGDTCKQNKASVIYKCGGCFQIGRAREDHLTEVISEEGTVAIIIDSKSLMFYTSGIMDDPACASDYSFGMGQRGLDHAVLLVGYDKTDEGQAYWIVKNSWGTDWGIDGYFWLARGKNRCGVSSDASFAKKPCVEIKP